MPPKEVRRLAALTRQQVAHVAHLARLAFEPDELDRFTAQLNSILDHVTRLEHLDTSRVEPTASVIAGASTPLRDDEPAPGLPREAALEAAPGSERGLFKVPRIID